jgi:peptidoglycan/LPS O-acetylase OafA/YrhL
MLTPSLLDTGWLNPVFWTLLIEASFYAIVGVVVLIWGSSRQMLWRFAWIWLGLTVLLSRIDDVTLHTLALFDWAPFFVIGILIGTAETRGDKSLAVVGMVAAALLAVDSTLETMNPEGRSINVISIIVFGLALIVALVVWFRPIANLESKKLAFIGTMTYSLYLFHVIPGRMIAEHLLKTGWQTLEAYGLSLLTTVVLSYVVTKFAEPIIRKGLRLAFRA